MSQLIRFIVWGFIYFVIFTKARAAIHERYSVFNYRSGDSGRNSVVEVFPVVVRIGNFIRGRKIKMGKKLAVFKALPVKAKVIYILLWLFVIGCAVWFFVNLHAAHII